MNGLGDVRMLLRLAGVRPRRFLLTVLLGLMAVLAGLALLGLSAYLIGKASRQPPILSLSVAIVTVRVLAISGPLARYGERYVGHDVALRALGRLRVAMFERIEPLAPGELDLYRDGDLVTRLVRDIDEVQDLFLRVVLPAAVAIGTVPIVVAALWIALPASGAVLLAGLVAALVAAPLTAYRATRRTQRRRAPLRARLTAELVDALDHAEELWLCGAADDVADRIAATEGELAAAARADARGAGVADALVTLLAGATSLVVLGIVGAAAHRGALDALLAAPLTLVALTSFEIVHPVAAGARSVDAARSAAARVLELAQRRPELHDPDVPAPEPGQRPTITTERLVVDRGTGAARTRALNEVSLALGPGERLVVRGPSGSGKSTLLLTLARFLERSAGDARLAGRDLHAYAQRDVRAEVVLLAQDPHVFDSTIRENVALARPGCTDDDVRDALGRAQLGAFVASLPDGLDTRVGASGRALSGGQRQRLAMARAFLAGGSVLLIDEPTAHLDQTTACRLLTDLWNAAEDRSVLLVTHGDPGPFHDCRTLQVEAVAPDHRPPH